MYMMFGTFLVLRSFSFSENHIREVLNAEASVFQRGISLEKFNEDTIIP